MSVALQDMSPYARSIVERLGLETHPEGGWYTRDWQSPHTDEASSRPLSSLIYFLLPAGHAVVPAGVWQRTVPGQGDALVSCVVSPGFVFDGFTLEQ